MNYDPSQNSDSEDIPAEEAVEIKDPNKLGTLSIEKKKIN